jgi:enolase-phosphatase E1
VTIRLRERGVHALVLDIEGTTTPIAFVYDILFPFARAHFSGYLRDRLFADDVLGAIARLRLEWSEDRERGEAPPEWPDAAPDRVGPIVAYLVWLMDRDRKSPALKWLQGQVWEEGYRAGALRGEVFDDVGPAFARWSADGIALAIYSSGSELAQRRLFGTTPDGDLTRFISRFFDTAIGPKTAAESYRRIAEEMRRPPERLLFVSDAAAELDAARAAGWQVALCIRPPKHDLSATAQLIHRSAKGEGGSAKAESLTPSVVQRFDEIVL